jgi:hypothetical protein
MALYNLTILPLTYKLCSHRLTLNKPLILCSSSQNKMDSCLFNFKWRVVQENTVDRNWLYKLIRVTLTPTKNNLINRLNLSEQKSIQLASSNSTKVTIYLPLPNSSIFKVKQTIKNNSLNRKILLQAKILSSRLEVGINRLKLLFRIRLKWAKWVQLKGLLRQSIMRRSTLIHNYRYLEMHRATFSFLALASQTSVILRSKRLNLVKPTCENSYRSLRRLLLRTESLHNNCFI